MAISLILGTFKPLFTDTVGPRDCHTVEMQTYKGQLKMSALLFVQGRLTLLSHFVSCNI